MEDLYEKIKLQKQKAISKQVVQQLQHDDLDDAIRVLIAYELFLGLENRQDMINLTNFIRQTKSELFFENIIQ